ncbi:ATP-binding protein [Paenibacillus sp. R14(2021)]|uniref:ATP-binding protein n=1 Tax=Paenibacillus sp. R14(2021) TaxID=2859228 RepID=UPI001C61515B|nr:ATP-binding protein [Paenibacillus sp. R14(2021)]
MSEGYRNLGFKVKDCISELIDNSFDQGADEIHMWFFEEEFAGVNRVSFLFQDNGQGVSSRKLNNFIEFRNDSSTLDIKKNGKFHWGLAASLGALSDYAEIYSIDSGTWYHTQYPYDGTSPKMKDPFAIEQIKYRLKSSSTGIIFYIQRISKVILAEVNDLEQLKDMLKYYIGETYRRDLIDKSIFINGEVIHLIDPLMRNNNRLLFYSDDECSVSLGTINIFFEDVKTNLQVQDSILVSDFYKRHLYYKVEFNEPIMELTMVRLEVNKVKNRTLPGFMKVNEENSGFYILRNRRQVDRAVKFKNINKMHNDYNQFRAELKFNPIYDELFGVQVNKSKIEIKSVIEQILYQKMIEYFGEISGRTVASKVRTFLKERSLVIKTDPLSLVSTNSTEIVPQNKGKREQDWRNQKSDEPKKEHTYYDFNDLDEEELKKIPEYTEDEHRANFNARVKNIKSREFIRFFYSLEIEDIDHRIKCFLNIIKPSLEGEVFGLLQMIKILSPTSIPFEILDYNDRLGLDCVARHNNAGLVGEYCFYVELKKELKRTMNHRLTLAKYIVCWRVQEHFKTNVKVLSALDGNYNLDSDASGFFVINKLGHLVRIIELEDTFTKLLKRDFAQGLN